MIFINVGLMSFLIFNITTILANEICFIKEEDRKKAVFKYRVVHCRIQYEECCNKSRIERLTEIGSGGKLSPFIWFLVVLISLGYIYFCLRYCYKKLCKKRDTPPSISRGNTQPQELNLMLSFNQNSPDFERFNFDNNRHMHVPFMPTTPVTPPPAYVTLTPPPTYNVAIHFPPIQAQAKQGEVLPTVEEEEPQFRAYSDCKQVN